MEYVIAGILTIVMVSGFVIGFKWANKNMRWYNTIDFFSEEFQDEVRKKNQTDLRSE